MAKKKNTPPVSPLITTLRPEVQEMLVHFFDCYPPKEFARGLRNLLVQTMIWQEEGPPDFHRSLMPALELFFVLLDDVEDNGLMNNLPHKSHS